MFCQNGKFSLFEQIWMQLSFHSIWILGAIAIFIKNPILSIGYVIIFPVFGILFCIMHLWICPRCPHIKVHSACIQMPPFITKRIIKKNVEKPMNSIEKIGFYIVLYGIFVVPIYWVLRINYLIIPFFIFVLMHYLAYYFRFCRRCLNIYCPQNLSK
jgi:hypothetical protein